MMVKYFTGYGTWVIRSNVRKVEWCWKKASASPWGEAALHERIDVIDTKNVSAVKTVLILLQEGDVEAEKLHILETNGVVYILNENGKTIESF